MKPMLLTSAVDIPEGDNWLYEVKYDGFRCLLHWDEDGPRLFSRNQKELTDYFPEIIAGCLEIEAKLKKYLPLILDGEIVYLLNPYQSDFATVQRRGKLRAKNQIEKYAKRLPTNLMVFDLLMLKGVNLLEQTLVERKKGLQTLQQQWANSRFLQVVESFEKVATIEAIVKENHSEGVVAKRKKSTYTAQRSKDWLKMKQYRYVDVIVTKYEKSNGYFQGSVYKGKTLIDVVHFTHGMSDQDKDMLAQLFEKNGELIQREVWVLPPSICAKIGCIHFDGEYLREPMFHSFVVDKDIESCTWQALKVQVAPFPEQVEITSVDKPIWPRIDYQKSDYLHYLQAIAPYMLPFLKDRLLTTIRYPHGAGGEAFYQKNCPDYAPAFIKTYREEDVNYMVCNDSQTLIWLGNQLALEFHLPFQKKKHHHPMEIVFDLDPPDRNHFSLAIKAALEIKQIVDQFRLQSFVKTSGNKGLQIYLPLPDETFTYKETRMFCEFVSTYIVEQYDELFTLERLKKNRNGRLYIDYLQHDQGKTMIAPYSARGHERGLVATPLYWEEVNDKLTPEFFTLSQVLERVRYEGDPFRAFRDDLEEQKQNFQKVIEQLGSLLKRS
ncbi:ATP-dependent DNA ligase [Alkalihalobacillus pseudalcaliphilus]|nr:ATP-dependent DNA ligase [Alkalihalobacillus pseudalcaliphilus]